MNVFGFTGNLGRDVDLREVNGTTVANFSVAAKAGYGEREQTIWVDCALWGKRAEAGIINYLKKGQQVAVHGELGTREYQKSDGSTGFSVTCRVGDVTLVGGKTESGGQAPAKAPQQTAQQTQSGVASSGDWDDEIPFN